MAAVAAPALLQHNYDFQPWLQDQLSTIESGLATNNDVEVTAGDMVYDTAGQPVTLEAGARSSTRTATRSSMTAPAR